MASIVSVQVVRAPKVLQFLLPLVPMSLLILLDAFPSVVALVIEMGVAFEIYAAGEVAKRIGDAGRLQGANEENAT